VLKKVNVLITGPPGSGKSTLIKDIVTFLKTKGISIGGISTPDFRSPQGRRLGFLIRDLASGEEQIMASTNIHSSLRVGKYGVDEKAIQEIGVKAIERAIEKSDLIVIDEIGKMELLVSDFQKAVLSAINSPRAVLGTIGLYLRSSFASGLKNRIDVKVFHLTPNRRKTIVNSLGVLLGISELNTGLL
jgi:nucleoside-triphosphatase